MTNFLIDQSAEVTDQMLVVGPKHLCSPILERINAYLMRWSQNKYKRLRGRKKAWDQWNMVVKLRPRFVAQWARFELSVRRRIG